MCWLNIYILLIQKWNSTRSNQSPVDWHMTGSTTAFLLPHPRLNNNNNNNNKRVLNAPTLSHSGGAPASSFLGREGTWTHTKQWQGQRAGEQKKGNKNAAVGSSEVKGSNAGQRLLHSLISCGRQGSRGRTESFPSEGAWPNSTQSSSQGWTPGFASGRCRRELRTGARGRKGGKAKLTMHWNTRRDVAVSDNPVTRLNWNYNICFSVITS